MTASKRAFDVVTAAVLLVALMPVMLIAALAILLIDGRPVFHVSERMRSTDAGFRLFKFRTMVPSKVNSGVTGGDKSHRVTRTGRWLRRTHLDEVPQLWNVLIGDMSLVGPRPPLREYVERFPELYADVLRARPGITGWATICFSDEEQRILAVAQTPQEVDELYTTECIPQKTALDIEYQQRATLRSDFMVLVRTLKHTS